MRRTLLVMALTAGAFAPGTASATSLRGTFSSCPESSFDNLLGRSPRNVEVGDPTFQYTYNGVLRNDAGDPVPNFPREAVELRILAPCQNPIILNPDADSDAQGRIQWGVAALDQGGGSCMGGSVVEIIIIGIGLVWILDSVTSPDEDGNGIVDLGDFSTFRLAFNSGSPLYQGDLDGDGLVALTDLAYFRKHFNAI